MGTLPNPSPESMTTLELVAWLQASEYTGRLDISRGLLVEAVQDVLHPVDWRTAAEVESAAALDGWESVTQAHDIRIQGEAGWFRFDKIVSKPGKAPWVDCHGGPKGHGMSRSFHLDRVARKPNGEIVVRTHVSRKDTAANGAAPMNGE